MITRDELDDLKKYFAEEIGINPSVKYAADYALKTIEDILGNDTLKSVIIMCELFEHKQLKWLLLASLISSDTLLSVSDCDRSLERVKFMKKYLDLFGMDDEEKKDVKRFINKSVKIIRETKEQLSNQRNTEKAHE